VVVGVALDGFDVLGLVVPVASAAAAAAVVGAAPGGIDVVGLGVVVTFAATVGAAAFVVHTRAAWREEEAAFARPVVL
jgi:hypothetical protein